MSTLKSYKFLVLLLLLLSIVLTEARLLSSSSSSSSVQPQHIKESLILSTFSLESNTNLNKKTETRGRDYSKLLGTLGMVCKCCDGNGGECRTTTWLEPCSNLQCHPWKQ